MNHRETSMFLPTIPSLPCLHVSYVPPFYLYFTTVLQAVSCHSRAPHSLSLSPCSWTYCCKVQQLSVVWAHSLSLSPPTFITLLSPFLYPLPVRPLLFDLPSLLPHLPLSMGMDYREVSLSLMTVGLMPARPPLCPQLVQLSRGTEGHYQRGGGCHRLTHYTKTNPRNSFQQSCLHQRIDRKHCCKQQKTVWKPHEFSFIIYILSMAENLTTG